MPGVQTLLPVMLTHVANGRLTLERLVDLTSHGAQRVFGIAGKGRMTEGYDGDLTIVDLKAKRTIKHENMATRSGWTPFDGMETTGWPMATIIRGRVVMREDEIVIPGGGKPVRFQETLGLAARKPIPFGGIAPDTPQRYQEACSRSPKPRSPRRLARIEGQVRGLSAMVDQDRYCLDVVTQVRAARAALAKVEQIVLSDHLGSCVEHAIVSGDPETAASEGGRTDRGVQPVGSLSVRRLLLSAVAMRSPSEATRRRRNPCLGWRCLAWLCRHLNPARRPLRPPRPRRSPRIWPAWTWETCRE